MPSFHSLKQSQRNAKMSHYWILLSCGKPRLRFKVSTQLRHTLSWQTWWTFVLCSKLSQTVAQTACLLILMSVMVPRTDCRALQEPMMLTSVVWPCLLLLAIASKAAEAGGCSRSPSMVYAAVHRCQTYSPYLSSIHIYIVHFGCLRSGRCFGCSSHLVGLIPHTVACQSCVFQYNEGFLALFLVHDWSLVVLCILL